MQEANLNLRVQGYERNLMERVLRRDLGLEHLGQLGHWIVVLLLLLLPSRSSRLVAPPCLPNRILRYTFIVLTCCCSPCLPNRLLWYTLISIAESFSFMCSCPACSCSTVSSSPSSSSIFPSPLSSFTHSMGHGIV